MENYSLFVFPIVQGGGLADHFLPKNCDFFIIYHSIFIPHSTSSLLLGIYILLTYL